MKVSVIIKALNEERYIAGAIESSLSALDTVGGGEVIVADSQSSDRTVEISKAYPVRVVQLTDAADRCCGVAAELGYRIAQGEYLYVLDADMHLESNFLARAVAELDQDQALAGVGGRVKEMNIANAEFRGRAESVAVHLQPGRVDRLNGGALYRKSAIDELGYLTNRNLHALEEFELAVRLREKGWRLVRLDAVAVLHYGYTEGSYRLLAGRWRSRYAWGGGELLREAWGSRYFCEVFKGVRLYRQSMLTLGWWAAILMACIYSTRGSNLYWLVAAITLLPFIAAVARRRSLYDGIYVVAFHCVYAAGILAGVLSKRRGCPKLPPSYRLIK